jgi:hypothetical protein
LPREPCSTLAYKMCPAPRNKDAGLFQQRTYTHDFSLFS